MAAREGFNFQSFHDSSSPITESPSLSCLSSSPKPIDHHGYGNIDCFEAEKRRDHRKSNSCILEIRRAREREIDSDEEEEDEKMDMLWEDFNEELLKNLSSRFGTGRAPELQYLESEEPKAHGGGGALLSARMASVVVIMKMLKKLLFMHSFRRKPKARTW